MAKITLPDIAMDNYEASDRVEKLRKMYFKAMPEICTERAKLITEFSRERNFFKQDKISILDKAHTYRHVLENCKPIIHHSHAYEKTSPGKNPKRFELPKTCFSLFGGSTTSKYKGVAIYPEFLGLTLWPELQTISCRIANPYHITPREIDILNQEVFPYWADRSILELGRAKYFTRDLDSSVELKLLQQLVFFLATKANCISHTIPDFSRAINEGLDAIIDQAQDKKSQTQDDSKQEFYEAIGIVLEGVIAYSNKLALHAEELAQKEKDPILQEELRELAQIHRRVPEKPASTFREGLTTVWVCWIAAHLENPDVGLSLGRLDQILYDLYRKDIDNGTLTVDQAIELICCLWLKIGDHVPTIADAGEQIFGGTGSNQAITIGGVDMDGNDAVNDLTYVMLRATEIMMLRDPNLNARVHLEENSEAYLRRVCQANINTCATPALHNDKAVFAALQSKGQTIEQARDYGIVGCVEPASNGRCYGDSAAVLLNLTSVLELTLFNGRHRHTGTELVSIQTGDPTGFESFEEFQDAFASQVRWMAEKTTNLDQALWEIHRDFQPTPILSALFEGPMEKGKDLAQNGATINNSGVTIIGLADVTDSITAIKKYVFDDKIIPFEKFLDAINSNFQGEYESLQKRLINPEKTPKYGNEAPEANNSVTWLLQLLNQTFAQVQGDDICYHVGYWTMTNHAGFGKFTRALPNGRKDQQNFTSGITPVSGVTPYLTPVLNSVAGLPADCVTNGMAFNLKFTPDNDRQKMLDNFTGYVKGFFDGGNNGDPGGMEIQFNVTKRETFEDAIAHPDKHSDLLVRVSGYTAYFVDLNPQMQKEIIERTEYDLFTGNAR